MRRVRLGLLFLLFLLLQGTVLSRLSLFGAVPNLILMGVTAFSFLNDEYDSLWIGIAAALLQDICYGAVVGISPLLCLAAGLLMKGIRTKVYRERKLIQLLVTALVTVLSTGGQWVLAQLIFDPGIPLLPLLRTIPAAIVWNYVVFLLLARFSSRREAFMFH